jgi:hypothetical protein
MSTIDTNFAAVSLPLRPYPGLRPFEFNDAPIFFGREQIVEEIIDTLIDRNLIVIHGSSGSGKSSVMQAGVLPRLARLHRRHGVDWRLASMRPGGGPLWNLAHAVASLNYQSPLPSMVDEIRLKFEKEPDRIHRAIFETSGTERIKVCLLVDQFEELFRFARESSKEESNQFIRLIMSALNNGEASAVQIVLTMRSEFLGECGRLPGLADIINCAQYLLPPMKSEMLYRAIRRPAELYGGEVTKELADRLVADADGEQDELPLIQHGLMRLWEGVSDAENSKKLRKIDVDVYEQQGPLRRLLDDHAEEVATLAASKSNVPREKIQAIFSALTDINVDGNAIRRPQLLRSLVATTGLSESSLIAVLDAFRSDTASFITPYSPIPLRPETTIDISHEALIRCWRALNELPDGWLHREFRNGLVWRSLLAQADLFEKDPKKLLGPATTADRDEWLTTRTAAWSERYGGGWTRVQHLMHASRAAAHRENRRDRFLTRTLVLLTSGLAIALVGIFILRDQAELRLQHANYNLGKALWGDLGTDPVLSVRSRNALWMLARSSPPVRQAFVAALESDPDKLLKLGAHPYEIMKALGPTWPPSSHLDELLDSVLSLIHGELSDDEGKTDNVVGYARVIESLSEALSQTQAEYAYHNLIDEMMNANKPLAIESLADAAQTVVGKLDEAVARQELKSLLNIMQGVASDPEHLSSIAKVTTAFSLNVQDTRELTRGVVQALLKVTRMKDRDKNVDSDEFQSLVQTFEILIARSDDLRSALVIRPAIRAALKTSNRREFEMVLDQTLQTFLEAPSQAEAQRVADTVIKAIQYTSDQNELEMFAGMFAGKLAPELAQLGIATVLRAMQGTEDPTALGNLAIAMKAMPDLMTRDQQNWFLQQVFQALQVRSDPAVVSKLASAALTLGGPWDDTRWALTVGALVRAIGSTDDVSALIRLARVLETAAPMMPMGGARQCTDAILGSMQLSVARGRNHNIAFVALASAVESFAQKMTPEQAKRGVSIVRGAIEGGSVAEPDVLISTLQKLVGRLNDLEVYESSEAALLALRSATDSDVIGRRAVVVQGFAHRLTAEEIPRTAGALLSAIKRVDMMSPLSSLANALTEISGRMPAALAEKTASELIEVIQELATVDEPDQRIAASRAIRDFVTALKGLHTQAPGVEMREVVSSLPVLIADIYDAEGLSNLAKATKLVAGTLSDAEAQQMFIAVMRGMRYLLKRLGKPSMSLSAFDYAAAQSDAFSLLAEASRELSMRLTEPQKEMAIVEILRLMESTNDNDAFRDLEEALSALVAMLPEPKAKEVLRNAIGWAASENEASAVARIFVSRATHVGIAEYAPDLMNALTYPLVGRSAMKIIGQALEESETSKAPPHGKLIAGIKRVAGRYVDVNSYAVPVCPPPISQKELMCPE